LIAYRKCSTGLSTLQALEPFDENAGIKYGILRAALPNRKRNAMDRLIAAHAISLKHTLVTNNVADFRDYPGLKFENCINNEEETSP
jgi:tRNA(fMet)-specific endonuclease VapC